ncbi:hypothetical protein [Roseibium sp. MMSF_3544]|uniref:hypothetical protein n=1 Tax=unclassified Roseibium TaxID=2629323 RepID=UPI00273F85CD|nr:hypothetical protein [Roseibium sp. MMSF_3544]
MPRSMTIETQRRLISDLVVMYRDNAQYVQDHMLEGFELWFSGSRVAETTFVTAVLTAATAGLATHLGSVAAAGSAGAAEATTVAGATTRMGVLLQNGQRALQVGSRVLAAPVGLTSRLAAGTAYEAYLTGAMCRIMAGLSVTVVKRIITSARDGSLPPISDLGEEILLMVAFSLLSVPGDEVDKSLLNSATGAPVMSRSIFTTTMSPGMFLAAPAPGYRFLSAQTVGVISKFIMSDTRAYNKQTLLDEALRQVKAKGASIDGMLDQSVNKLAGDVMDQTLRLQARIRDEIHRKSFTDMVPTTYKLFDFRGNTETFNSAMQDFMTYKTLQELWLEVGVALTDLDNQRNELKQRAASAANRRH